MNKITISDIDNSIDDIYNTQINITNVKLYIDSAIITDLFNDIPNTLVLKYKTCLNNEATIIGIDSNILKNFGDKQVYISYERGTGDYTYWDGEKKNDYQDGKLRWDLLPLEEIEDIVKLYTAGSIKYGDNNWQNLDNGYQRYKAAMLRHLLEYEKGNKVDDETKVNHLAAVAWNAIAMLYLDKHGKGKDYDIK